MKDAVTPRFSAALDFKRWRWTLLVWHRRVGTMGAVAIAGGFAIAVVQCAWMHPKLLREQTHLAEVRQSLAADLPMETASAPELTTDARLQAIFAVLARHRLTYREARYHASRGAMAGGTPGASALAVALPVDGRYPDARAALAALTALPGVHVERLSMRRDTLHTERLAMTLRIVVTRGGQR